MSKTVWISPSWLPVKIGFCPTNKAWTRTIKKYEVSVEDPPLGKFAATTDYFREQKLILVTMVEGWEKGKSLIEVTGVLAHEAVHVFQGVADAIGEREPSAEFEAYSIQAIYQDLVWAWWEDRGRNMGLKFNRFDKD